MTPRRRAEGILLLVTAVWGTTFVVVKEALDSWPPFGLSAWRFGLAGLVFLPVLARPGALSARTVRRGAVLGLLLFLGFGLQTLGLARTSEARSAFFTALSTILVPILGWACLGRRPVSGTLAAMALGLAGILCLAGREIEPSVRTGDLLTVGCAVVFALQIVTLAEFLRDTPVLPLTGVELATTSLLSLVAWRLEAKPLPALSAGHAGLVVYLGLLATAGTLWGQVAGQRDTTANRAAFLFALEPVFAVFFAWLARGRVPYALEWAGGALIVLAAVLADRPLRARLARADAGGLAAVGVEDEDRERSAGRDPLDAARRVPAPGHVPVEGVVDEARDVLRDP